MKIAVALAAALLATPALAAEVYANDLPQKRPAEYRVYSQALQRAVPAAVRMEDWISRLNGVAGPLEASRVDGKPMLTGWVCKPHDCLMNKVYMVVDKGRMAALIEISDLDVRTDTVDTRVFFVGQMTPGEKRCLLTMQSNSSERC